MFQQNRCGEETTAQSFLRRIINKLRFGNRSILNIFHKILAEAVALPNARDLFWSSCRENHVEKHQLLLVEIKEFIRQISLNPEARRKLAGREWSENIDTA